jgi:hypothetical protein
MVKILLSRGFLAAGGRFSLSLETVQEFTGSAKAYVVRFLPPQGDCGRIIHNLKRFSGY